MISSPIPHNCANCFTPCIKPRKKLYHENHCHNFNTMLETPELMCEMFWNTLIGKDVVSFCWICANLEFFMDKGHFQYDCKKSYKCFGAFTIYCTPIVNNAHISFKFFVISEDYKEWFYNLIHTFNSEMLLVDQMDLVEKMRVLYQAQEIELANGLKLIL